MNTKLGYDRKDAFQKIDKELLYYESNKVSRLITWNKQKDFANWLYGVPKTCKEGNGNQCVGNNMEKLNGESYKFYYCGLSAL